MQKDGDKLLRLLGVELGAEAQNRPFHHMVTLIGQ